MGNAATFSMYATKNMAMGEGGMVTTNDAAVAEKVRIFINHGMPKAYYHTEVGFNYRTTDVEAAIGIQQLKKLDGFNVKRRQNADRLREILKPYDFIQSPVELGDRYHIYHQFTIRIKDGLRDKMVEHLNSKDVGSKIFYPIPLHKQPVYKGRYNAGKQFPVAEKAAAEVASLPIHPLLTDADFNQISDAFKTFSGGK
jgi:perosamine synthetase